MKMDILSRVVLRVIACVTTAAILVTLVLTNTLSYAADSSRDIIVEVTTEGQICDVKHRGAMGERDTFDVKVSNLSDNTYEGLEAFVVLLDRNKEMNVDLEEFEADMFHEIQQLAALELTELQIDLKYFLAGDYFFYICVLDTNESIVYTSNILEITVTGESKMETSLVRNVAIAEPVIIGLLGVTIMWLRKKKVSIG